MQKISDFSSKMETPIPLSNLSIIGIMSHSPCFMIASEVNHTAKTDFYKEEELEVWVSSEEKYDRLESFFFESPTDGCQYILLEAKNTLPCCIKQWEQCNCVLLIVGMNNREVALSLVKKLNEIKNISMAKIITDHQQGDTIDLQLSLIDFDDEQSSDAPCDKSKGTNKEETSYNEAVNSLIIDIDAYLTKISTKKERTKLSEDYLI
ncbi:MAG: hypothetical protein ACI3Z9_06915 [Candidatus Onthomorpha sp.]